MLYFCLKLHLEKKNTAGQSLEKRTFVPSSLTEELFVHNDCIVSYVWWLAEYTFFPVT